MKRYIWSEEKIAVWHKETFPNISTREQRIKASLEAREYYAAATYDERVEELADFYICNAALSARFGCEGGRLVCQLIRDGKVYPWDEVAAAVDRKMEVNLHRRWDLVCGEYRHAEGK